MQIDDYKNFLNQVVGFISMGLAIGALSTENPRFFAGMALLVMIAHLLSFARGFFAGHSKPHFGTVMKEIPEYIPYLAGVLLLFFVAIGWIDNTGWKGCPLP